jgi:predicted transcriptional regulator
MDNTNQNTQGAFEGTAKEFIEVYNELTYTLRKNLGLEDYVDFNRLLSEAIHRGNRVIAKYEVDLKILNELRNSIAHNPYMAEADPIAEPHPAVVEKLRMILNEIENPPKALDKGVKASDIYKALISDKLKDVLKVMHDKLFSWVLIYDKPSGQLIGVFSEDVLFAYISSNEGFVFDEKTTLEEFKDYLSLDRHPNEYFEFVNRSMPLYDVEKIFKHSINGEKRLAVVFITESGKPSEGILGMLTAWDMLD